MDQFAGMQAQPLSPETQSFPAPQLHESPLSEVHFAFVMSSEAGVEAWRTRVREVVGMPRSRVSLPNRAALLLLAVMNRIPPRTRRTANNFLIASPFPSSRRTRKRSRRHGGARSIHLIFPAKALNKGSRRASRRSTKLIEASAAVRGGPASFSTHGPLSNTESGKEFPSARITRRSSRSSLRRFAGPDKAASSLRIRFESPKS